jgi:hypothetical protein
MAINIMSPKGTLLEEKYPPEKCAKMSISEGRILE